MENMQIEKILLNKDELPIIKENMFQIPIFPNLLQLEKVNQEIALKAFPIAAREWYEDLQEYVKTLPQNTSDEQERKKWLQEVFLNKPVKIVKRYGRQKLNFWEDLVQYDNNGFVTGFSISRNAGGSLYLGDKCEREEFAMSKLIRFTEEKKRLYCINPKEQYPKMIMYSKHNIDYYPGALFLRNWAILYLNEALRELDKQGKL